MGGEYHDREGWKEWSKHVLGALERLDKQLDAMRQELNKATVDITRLGFVNSSLSEMDNKLLSLKKEIASQENEFKVAVLSLESDDKSNMKRVEDQLSALNRKIDDLNEFMSRAKTIAWVIGSIIAALVGMFSLSLRDVIK